ncbi:unnamed protein product [Lepeophtheirus salmonis]|uniref:(salmon louse) hypothetical protein n=1 Tax=Lepeophtheirus salmonis TaxID=72036 RepID=A0A7R8CRM2_LEPSM|nr:unnamed protein product [Lepeophtheirus salmonis]CAF2904694.1 unnamed protein product [Lepeophtheirus salmonis]
MSLGVNISPARLRMERARTPMGSVPISTIWGYDYPLSDAYYNSVTRNVDDFKESVDSIMRRSRALSESRVTDYHTHKLDNDNIQCLLPTLTAQLVQLKGTIMTMSSTIPTDIHPIATIGTHHDTLVLAIDLLAIPDSFNGLRIQRVASSN